MNELILIDFSWVYNKYFFVNEGKTKSTIQVIQDSTLKSLGEFMNIIHNNYPEARIICTLDSPVPTKNKVLFPDYKGKRTKKEGIESGMKSCVHSFLRSHKFLTFAVALEYEADQVIASLASKFHSKSKKVIIYSGDKDLVQLTSFTNVVISDKFEKGKFLIKNDEELFDKFKNSKGEGFTRISTNKRDILKFRTLRGDSSDNIPAVFPRIKDADISNIIKNYWVSEKPLTDKLVSDIIKEIKSEDEKLATKLDQNKEEWLRNYKLMNLLNIEGIVVKKVSLK